MHEIRLVHEKDIQILAEIFAEAFSAADDLHPWDMGHARAYLEYWMQKQPDMFFCACIDDLPIGAMAVNIKPWRTGVRCSDGVVFVDSKYQRQGIANALFKKVIGAAMKKYGAEEFEAVTFAGEEFPLTWYKKIGINPDIHAVLIKGRCEEILEKLG